VDSNVTLAVVVLSLFVAYLAVVLASSWRAVVATVVFCITFPVVFGIAMVWITLRPS